MSYSKNYYVMLIFNSLQQKQQDRLKEKEESKSTIDSECFYGCIVYVVNKLCHSGAWPTVTVYRLAGRNKLMELLYLKNVH